jgi:hypothetical protein
MFASYARHGYSIDQGEALHPYHLIMLTFQGLFKKLA